MAEISAYEKLRTVEDKHGTHLVNWPNRGACCKLDCRFLKWGFDAATLCCGVRSVIVFMN
jgi:hypothetical protein